MYKILKKLNKKNIIITIVVFIVLATIVTSGSDNTQKLTEEKGKNYDFFIENKKTICDGIDIVSNCEYDNIEYDVYKYYPATEEKSHIETKTTYTKEITGYCTLCNDGTYSPSCATGRGACSHHGGVAKWNAPIYKDVPKYEQIRVVDSQAAPERYQKLIKTN